MMRVLELFSGTASFSKVATARGHECRTVDIELPFNPTYRRDILTWIPEKDLKDWTPEIIWASPPCQCFSVAAISRNWNGSIPKRPRTVEAVKIVERTVAIIRSLNPKYYFIENPRGMMRKLPVMQELPRKTVTYCQYGMDYQKATDIWNNCDSWKPKPVCSNKTPCPVRNLREGREGRRRTYHPFDIYEENSWNRGIERAIVPPMLCEEILIACENVPFDSDSDRKG
jgi:hypothetical protein